LRLAILASSAKAFSMLEVEEAQARIISTIQPLPEVSVPTAEALGRFVSQSIASPVSLPLHDTSAMDGFAVMAESVRDASAAHPVRLKCVGSQPAGESQLFQLDQNSCVRVFTGSRMPKLTDAVVMQEDTRFHDGYVDVLDAVKPKENVRFQGEDVPREMIVAKKGDKITATKLALLSAVGLERVPVSPQPLIGVLSTGNELIEAGQSRRDGQIFESNRAMIAALAAAAGAMPRVYPLVPDSLTQTRAALELAFAECDAVVTSGGVSVGEHDFVKAAFESIGGTLDFWQVAMKPGKPFAFGRLANRCLFGLPGNPVSAFVTFLLLARPAILKLQAASDLSLPAHPGTLAELLRNSGPRRHFMRVTVDSQGQVRSAGVQASHILSSLSCANGMVNVPPDTLLPIGSSVQVLRWEL
jgi:molybdopterin molybdotransferase